MQTIRGRVALSICTNAPEACEEERTEGILDSFAARLAVQSGYPFERGGSFRWFDSAPGHHENHSLENDMSSN